uniref:Uncharacterized protein n=1 Tax=Pyxicephalus adspersus TaxID=30357 RepID=A0AAV2ZYI2_PYXAD|nr:TPA: hypothetical protein GDO54_004300 [Pyxicephalus adspersus]
MHAQLWCPCLAVVSVVADDVLVDDCILTGGDKKSPAEQALLRKLAPLDNKRFERSVKEGEHCIYVCNVWLGQ